VLVVNFLDDGNPHGLDGFDGSLKKTNAFGFFLLFTTCFVDESAGFSRRGYALSRSEKDDVAIYQKCK
jgi:hypothetical protein